jgi:hypothetical protein
MHAWLSQKLLVKDVDGRMRPPGAGPGLNLEQPDGTQFSVLARGDSFDLFWGRTAITVMPITVPTMMALARFLVRWWFFSTWCGIKLALWRWTMTRRLDTAERRG